MNKSEKFTISIRPLSRTAYPYYGPHEIGQHFDNIAGDTYLVITAAQAQSFEHVIARQGGRNLQAISLEFGPNPALMVNFTDILVGIESDGYAHS